MTLGVESGRLDDRIGFITGAASGIGRAMAEEFASRGAQVAACDIDGDGAERTAAAAKAAGAPAAIALAADVARAGDVETAVSRAEDQLGRSDILCSKAGIRD